MPNPLTTREKDVLKCIQSGLTRRLTSDKLGLSPSTVSVHCYNARVKLGLSNNFEMLRWLLKNEL